LFLRVTKKAIIEVVYFTTIYYHTSLRYYWSLNGGQTRDQSMVISKA
jgi:hypothetical protein